MSKNYVSRKETCHKATRCHGKCYILILIIFISLVDYRQALSATHHVSDNTHIRNTTDMDTTKHFMNNPTAMETTGTNSSDNSSIILQASHCTALNNKFTSTEKRIIKLKLSDLLELPFEQNCGINVNLALYGINTQQTKVLKEHNLILSKTLNGAYTMISLFLIDGNKTSGETAKHYLDIYVTGKRELISRVQTLLLNKTTSTSIRISFESCIKTLDEIESITQILTSVCKIVKSSASLESRAQEIRNASSMFVHTRKYDLGETTVQKYSSYITELDSVVNYISNFKEAIGIHNLSVLSDIPWIKCITESEKWKSNLKTERQKHKEFVDMFATAKVLQIFRMYVDPIVYLVVLTVGIIWNGVLILMFVQQRQLRTSANIMILNLAVGDIFSLILNLPLFYFAHYYVPQFHNNELVCKFFTTIRPLFVAVSALSVAALSILRYFATGQSFKIHSATKCCKLSTRSRITLYIFSIWVLSLGLALPYSFLIKFVSGHCFRYGDGQTAKMVTLCEFMFYCVVLPSIMLFFNTMTAKELRKSTKDLPHAITWNGQDVVRNRSAKVLTALIIVFLASYVPHHSWRLLHRWLELRIWEIPYRSIDKITYYMLFANSCFNPISLYIVSANFRKLFNYYFLYLNNKIFRKNSTGRLQKFAGSSLTL